MQEMILFRNPTNTRFQRLLAFLGVMGGIIWLGGSIVRAAIAFDMFIPGTLTFKPTMSAEAMLQTIRLFGMTAFYTMFSYGLFVVLGTAYWLSLRGLWRVRGGVFIAGMLFLLYVPVEAVQMYYDIHLVMMIQDGALALEAGKTLVLKRISVLNGALLLAMLGYISAVLVLCMQPLTRAPATQAFEEQPS